jgi:hypothetical protein
MVQVSEMTRQCIDISAECANTCAQTIAYCLQQGGRHAEPSHIKLLLDCAEICRTCADFTARDSDFTSRICGFCAEVCQRCADDCASFSGDAQMQACADICRRCAELR